MHFVTNRRRKGAVSPLSRGQSLVEFAIVLPVLMLIIGAIIQFGIIFWGQNTLTQIARDTGRWAATQNGCDATVNVLGAAKSIAANSSLIGPPSSGWTSPANVKAEWSDAAGGPPPVPCPPLSNIQVAFVKITITHQVPVFFPWIPGNGNLTTIAQFRMEPHP
ncbi:MAG TPA: TadE family protein [Candidatus Limnocylindrales bacterium]|nr:TadE family protein [Candidatus Limnocylindrales bacterium]